MKTVTISKSLEEQLKHFISSYRLMEKSSYQYGYKIIRETLLSDDGTKMFNHICDHWKGKRKGFGQWFLNTSTERKIKLLHYWGLTDQKDDEYLAKCDADPTFHFFAETPDLVNQVTRILLFFENNGIYPGALPDVALFIKKWPKKPKDFGNSANWADFILSSSQPNIIVNSILNR